MPVVLAHGALGPYDELIFAAVGIAFLVMMGVSWLRSRNLPSEDDENAAPLNAESTSQDSERYRLQ